MKVSKDSAEKKKKHFLIFRSFCSDGVAMAVYTGAFSLLV